MKSEKLKINVAQRILDLSNDKLLKKISAILDAENVVGYNADGKPIFEKDYVNDVNSAIQEFNEGKMETYSSEEVKRRILGK